MEIPTLLKLSEVKSNRYDDFLYIPFKDYNGLFIEYDKTSFSLADEVVQYLSLQILEECSINNLLLHIYDPDCKGNYSHLNSLAKKSKTIKILNSDKISDLSIIIQERIKEVKFDILGRDFKSLHQYNETSNEKEPYHLFVMYGINDRNYSDNLHHFVSLISDSAKYGIYFIIISEIINTDDLKDYDPSKKKAEKINTLLHNDIFKLTFCQKSFKIEDDIYKEFIDAFGIKLFDYEQQSALIFNQIFNQIYLKEAQNPEKNFLEIPIGTKGREPFYLEMGGKSKVVHGMIGGTSGSGKSYLLNVILAEIAKKYSSDEIRLFLFDYKMGLEFDKFSEHPCLQYKLSSKQRTEVKDNTNSNYGVEQAEMLFKHLIDEMEIRKTLFNKYGKIESYNTHNPDSKLPYNLIIIDEFQELFMSGRQSRDFDKLFNKVARQGRAYGIHLLFSSNSFNGVQFESSTRNQVHMRIGFKMADSDVRYIMGDNSFNFLELERGDAVYNANMGNNRDNNKIKINYLGEEDDFIKIIDETRKLPLHKKSKPFSMIEFHTSENKIIDNFITSNSHSKDEMSFEF